MLRGFVFVVSLLPILWTQCLCAQECSSFSSATCEECISSSPHCAWCKDKNFAGDEELTPVRCDSRASLRERGCAESDIMDPESLHSITDSPGRKGRRAALLSPQNVSMELRPGKPLTFEVQVKRPKKAPVDVYYLTSLSFAGKHRSHSVVQLGAQVLSAVQEVSPEAHSRGFGLFGDPNDPDSERSAECTEGKQGCRRAFSFSHSPSLTKTPEKSTQVPQDPSEGGLLALMQTAVCGDTIGWGNNARLLVFVSDHGFRAAEGQTSNTDGVGNSEQCHLTEGQHISRKLGYPSVPELAHKLTENNIQIIFAVTEEVADKYKELSDLLPKSTVAVLPSDLSNIKAVIKEAYNALSSMIVVSHTSVRGLNISYAAECADGEQRSLLRGACNNTESSRKTSLKVTISSESCMESQSFHLQLLGSPDKLSVEVKSLCRCECGDGPNPEFCNYSGKFTCGICRCYPEFIGRTCDCFIDEGDAQCRMAEGSPVCSGRGDCVCGQCHCNKRDDPNEHYTGQYCECDDFSCDRHNGMLCGGRGQCVCGKCFCDPKFVGAACECSAEVDQCSSPDGRLCSGRGNCICNMCKCSEPYSGKLCENLPF